MPDTPVGLLVVTPAGEVRDYLVIANTSGLVTARSILEALYDQIGCTTVDVVALSPEIDMWVDDEGAFETPGARQPAGLLHRNPVRPAVSAVRRNRRVQRRPGRPGQHQTARQASPRQAQDLD
ncbi:MAG: hypothetical protein WBA97_03370 [Actinophytocola sp.]|uniref:hypothetical protein n=1 Tax=Actinophytocola sp. TaxID=1872138 RepID=UPI003C74DCC0